jgi:hypothetical protein
VRPRKSSGVYDELLPDGGLVLFQSQKGLIVTLNPTGALVWECCDGMHDLDAIVAELRDVFPSAPAPDRDVRSLLRTLCQGAMIEDVGAAVA